MSFAPVRGGSRASDQVGAESEEVTDEEVARGSRRRVGQLARRTLLVATPLAALAACAFSLRGRSVRSPTSRRHELQELWSIRHSFDDEEEAHEATAECVVDNGLAALYIVRSGFEINGAVEACKEEEKLMEEKVETYKEVLERVTALQTTLTKTNMISKDVQKDANQILKRAGMLLHADLPAGARAAAGSAEFEESTEAARIQAKLQNAEYLATAGQNAELLATARRLSAALPKLVPGVAGATDMKEAYAKMKELPNDGLDRLQKKYGGAVMKQLDAKAASLGVDSVGGQKPGAKFVEGLEKVKERLRRAQDAPPHAATEGRSAHGEANFAKATLEQQLVGLNTSYNRLDDRRNRVLAMQRECAAEVIGSITSFGYIAALYSAVGSECGKYFSQEEYCSSDAARFVPSLSEMGAGAAGVSVQCDRELYKYLHKDEQENRRLSEEKEVEVEEKGTHAAPSISNDLVNNLRGNAGEEQPHGEGHGEGTEEQQLHAELEELEEAEEHEKIVTRGECALDITQSVFMFARAGLEINAALVHCNEGDAARCAGTTNGVIASIALGSMMISNAVDECPDGSRQHFEAACASSVLQLTSGTFELAATASFFGDSCLDDDDTGKPAPEVIAAGEPIPYGYPTGVTRHGEGEELLLKEER